MREPAKVVTTDADIDAAIRRARIYSKYDQRVRRAEYSASEHRVLLHMDNGASVSIPIDLLQGLKEASPDQLSDIEVLGNGTGLYWPTLDVAHSAAGLLAGVYGSEKWMERLHREQEGKRIPA